MSLLDDITLDGKKVRAEDLAKIGRPVHFKMVDGSLVVETIKEDQSQQVVNPGPLPG